MEEIVYLSQERKVELEEELHELLTIKRKEVAQKIKEARAQGDLSENAEYDAAKAQQGEMESRIAEINAILGKAEVISKESGNLGEVSMGDRVLVKDVEFDEEEEYTIVGSVESNPSKGFISNESPIGKALLGAKEGQTVKVEAPQGEFSLQILKITK